MRVQLYTELSHLIERVLGLIPEAVHIEAIEQLADDLVVLTDPDNAKELMGERPMLRVMVLSDTPSYTEGSQLLPIGIRGYANTYIHLTHLEQALATIESGNVWLYPEFMQELIQNATGSAQANEKVLEKLTERERETALLVKKGLSNKEIASRLEITERTVKQHMSHIFEKLGVGDRLALAMLLK
jgi:DNA-binding NarL/FixJ family response regulator